MSSTPPLRRVTRVAVGVVLRDDGAVLLADRPAGKPYAGYWEFPGGKIETDEPVDVALRRELHEELGIEIGPSTPWVTFEYDYPHAFVRLYFRRVSQWHGVPHAREGQRFRFVDPAGEMPQPLLPAAVPALRWLRLPQEARIVSADRRSAADSGDGGAPADRPRLIVIETDWRTVGAADVVSAWRKASARGSDVLLAAGSGAEVVDGVDGLVCESVAAAQALGVERQGWRGVWADAIEDLPAAQRAGADFVLLRRLPAAQARGQGAVLPMFVPLEGAVPTSGIGGDGDCAGSWLNLRERA